ncbi:MAG: 2-amino-4-hydroxy-6-hydroxymethyldihydropteridine diphosphokinase [Bacillota bacterium]|nr:2-amino-4-hydroxy-6-hydroxymethyldihydropteridine diphosphokinase [Bacillota bacterium]
MDKIYIKDLEIYGYHGVNPEEKAMGQRFLISLDISIDLKHAGESDNIEETINYAEVCYNVEKEFNKQKYNLIEAAAEHLADYLLLNYEQIKEIKVLIKKPWAPIGKPIDYAAVEVKRAWHTAYIGVGSNIGDKRNNIQNAIKEINGSGKTKVNKVSNLYETSPVGYLDQDDFLNCALEIKTLLKPSDLIDLLLSVESNLKRERVIKWGPRTIDLDVLLYDDIVTHDEKVIIPHPRMHERLFVIKPLKDIAPYVMHPILKKRIVELDSELSKTEQL